MSTQDYFDKDFYAALGVEKDASSDEGHHERFRAALDMVLIRMSHIEDTSQPPAERPAPAPGAECWCGLDAHPYQPRWDIVCPKHDAPADPKRPLSDPPEERD